MPRALSLKNALICYKAESVEGTFNAPTPASDYIVQENGRLTWETDRTETAEVTGGLDVGGGIPGGTRATLTMRCYMTGWAIAATGNTQATPNWAKPLPVCGWAETATASAVPASAEACAAGGSTTTAKLGTSASTTADQYNGMPINFTGTVAGSAMISDYAADKVATLTDQFSAAIVASTNYQIPANNVYRPISASIPTGSFEVYVDGLRYQLRACRGNAQFVWPTRGVPYVDYTFQGLLHSEQDVALPSVSVVKPLKTVFRDAYMWLGSQEVGSPYRYRLATREFNVGNGVQLVNLDDPNESDGYRAPLITERRVSGSLDPLATLVAEGPNYRNLLTNGYRGIICARTKSAIAGANVGLVVPAAEFTSDAPGDRDSAMTRSIEFQGTGTNQSLYLAVW
jgi:hypothetical protein